MCQRLHTPAALMAKSLISARHDRCNWCEPSGIVLHFPFDTAEMSLRGQDCKTCSLWDLCAHYRRSSSSRREGNPSPGHIHQAMMTAGCMKILKQPVRELRSSWTWWQHLLYSQDHSSVSGVCGRDKSSGLQLSAPEVNHLNGPESPSREQKALTLTKMESVQHVICWCCPVGYKWYLPLEVLRFSPPINWCTHFGCLVHSCLILCKYIAHNWGAVMRSVRAKPSLRWL